VTLTLTDGSRIDLPVSQLAEDLLPDEYHVTDYRRSLAVELAEAHERARHQLVEDQRIIPGRAGRDLAEWRAAIRHATRPGYRQSAITAEALLRVVRDPSAPAESRVGAAIALQEIDGSDIGTLLVEAAAHCANPRFRAALEQVLKPKV
jgi:hypothetical protein